MSGEGRVKFKLMNSVIFFMVAKNVLTSSQTSDLSRRESSKIAQTDELYDTACMHVTQVAQPCLFCLVQAS